MRMTWAAYLGSAASSLRQHPLRSLLTVLGVVIGVASVIAVLAVGTGTRERIIAQIQSLGGNLILVSPGSARVGGAHLGAGARPSITLDDAQAIERETPGTIAVAPSVFRRLQVVRGNANWSTTAQGVTPAYFTAREWGVDRGRSLTWSDMDNAAKVALLGETVAKRLFADANPVGELVRVAETPFLVVGVLRAKGQSSSGADQDDKVMIPLSTAMSRVFGAGQARLRSLNYVMVKVRDADLMSMVEDEITRLLRQRHRLASDAPDDFVVRNLAEVQSRRAEASGLLTFWLTAVASVSLVVGGISIMNILLVSVSERTREIGLRMAVGAKRRDIARQFLAEALALSLLGGVAGLGLGAALSWAVSAWAEIPVAITPGGLFLALGAALITGVCSGLFPALKAARLTPIDALRVE